MSDDDDPCLREKIPYDSSLVSKSPILFQLLTSPAIVRSQAKNKLERGARSTFCSTNVHRTTTDNIDSMSGLPSEVILVIEDSSNSISGVTTGGYSVLSGVIAKELVNGTNHTINGNCNKELQSVLSIESNKSAYDDNSVDHSSVAKPVRHVAPNLLAHLTSHVTPVLDNSSTTLRSLLIDNTAKPLPNGKLIAAHRLNEASQPSVLRNLLSSSSRRKKRLPAKKNAPHLKKRITNSSPLPLQSPNLRTILPKITHSVHNLRDNNVKLHSVHEDSFHGIGHMLTAADTFMPVVPQNLIKVDVMQDLNDELSVDEILPDVISRSPVKKCDETVNGYFEMEEIKIEPQEPMESELAPSIHFQATNKIEVFVDSILGTVMKFEQNGHFDNIDYKNDESQHFFEKTGFPQNSDVVSSIVDKYICFSDNV